MYRLTDRGLGFKLFFVSDNLSLNSNLTHTLHTIIIYYIQLLSDDEVHLILIQL